MVRRRLEKDEARALILNEAKTLFFKKGYTHTTMEELRKNCGMSKGNLYYHFNNKESIFVSLIEEYIAETMSALDNKLNTASSCREKLLVIAEDSGEDCRNPLMITVEEFCREAENLEAAEEMATVNLGKLNEYIGDIVIEGIRNGELKKNNAEIVTLSILSMLAGIGQFCLASPDITQDKYPQIHVDAMKTLVYGIAE